MLDSELFEDVEPLTDLGQCVVKIFSSIVLVTFVVVVIVVLIGPH